MLNTRIIFVLLLSFLVASCGEKSSAPQTAEDQQSAQTSAATNRQTPNIDNGHIDVTLSSIQMSGSGDYCDMYIEVKNATKFNFTALGIEYILRDGSGNILKKMVFRDLAAPNKDVVMRSTGEHCSQISSIEFPSLQMASEIDGEFVSNDNLLSSIPIKSASKVSGVSVKSSGGSLDKISKANTGNDLVDQLSYCGAIAVGQSIWQKQYGDPSVAATLEKGAFAYAKTAIEFGMANGLSESEVITINKSNNNKVTEEMKNKSFFDASLLNEKNNTCLSIVKINSTLLPIWQRYFNS